MSLPNQWATGGEGDWLEVKFTLEILKLSGAALSVSISRHIKRSINCQHVFFLPINLVISFTVHRLVPQLHILEIGTFGSVIETRK